MKILFTAGDTFVGRAIRYLTKEPMSHVAIEAGEFVAHSTIFGVEIVTTNYFKTRFQVVDAVEVQDDMNKLLAVLTKRSHSFYDYGCLLYLGVRYSLKRWLKVSIPKANLWATSGMFTCTEFVTEVLDGKQDSLITPYGLYERLKNHRTGN
jgi:hypothetical protein